VTVVHNLERKRLLSLSFHIPRFLKIDEAGYTFIYLRSLHREQVLAGSPEVFITPMGWAARGVDDLCHAHGAISENQLQVPQGGAHAHTPMYPEVPHNIRL
jgi:hypothetical protein